MPYLEKYQHFRDKDGNDNEDKDNDNVNDNEVCRTLKSINISEETGVSRLGENSTKKFCATANLGFVSLRVSELE